MRIRMPKLRPQRMSKAANKIYHSAACLRLFEEAWDRFPDYNTDQAPDAADWIFDGLKDKFPKAGWDDKLSTEIYEAIYAGLT
jgi:hypothetical protein